MRTLIPVVALLVVAVGCGKPNPKLSKIVENQADDDPDTTTELAYDSSNRLSAIERVEGEDTKNWDLTWEGSLLVKVNVRAELGGVLIDDDHELTWEGGGRVEVSSNGDSGDATTKLSYDGSGRLAETVTERDTSETTTTLEYDGDGAIELMSSEVRADAGGVQTTEFEIDREAGRIVGLTLVPEAGDDLTFDFEYDEEKGRLSQLQNQITVDIAGEPTVVTTTMVIEYDDQGRIDTAEQTGEANGTEVDIATFELSYDDGDASSLDVTPTAITLLPFLFGLKGGSHAGIDNTTGVPRIAFDSF